ncbi:hypothetical protein ABZ723_17260 [Streptomyces sp. NPDC006700]|uniref:hypothetical protein n=1 Tax=unclassified Streptomyces TaxID=2593676 RepID=UPI00340DFDFE
MTTWMEAVPRTSVVDLPSNWVAGPTFERSSPRRRRERRARMQASALLVRE